MRRITLEELKVKAAALKEALAQEDLDILFWLKELSPAKRLNFPYDTEEKISVEEHNKRTEKWNAHSKEFYRPIRKQMLERIFTRLENQAGSGENNEQTANVLLEYLDEGSQPVRNKVADIIKLGAISGIIEQLIEESRSTDENIQHSALSKLNALNLWGDQWTVRGLGHLSDALIAGLKDALQREYDNINPYYDVFFIIAALSGSIPEKLAGLQADLVLITDIGKLDFEDYETLMYVYEQSWEDLKAFWDADHIALLQEKIAATAREQFGSDDYWVEEYMLTPLEMIGKGNPNAEETIEWLKSKL